MQRVWAPHEELVYAPCWFEKREDKDAVFRDQDKNEVRCPVERLEGLHKVVDAQLLGVDNICTLEEVNEAALLHTVRVRYHREQIYTRVARIVIGVNPFKAVPIYSPQHLEKYLKASDSMELPPHVYGVGLDAMAGLRRGDGKNQAVLISGESGSGKTETTKLVMSYVAEALGGAEDGIQDKIMRTNPVLESFGNAMTERNNNSSRFGKWLQIVVSGGKRVRGCSVVDYLLELTRVCAQGPKERNYHVFFQLIQARGDALLQGLQVGDAESYGYLRGAQLKAPGIDDARCFEELRDAFDGLGYSPEVQREVFRVVLGILTLGNVEFVEEGEAAQVVDVDVLLRAADLLGLREDALKAPMVVRRIMVGKDVTEARRTAAQAKAARDGLARLLYGRLFKWLIVGINSKLSEDGNLDGQFFGVLDIAGFESFEVNSIEQLFINLSNEHLQLHFNNHIFKMELDDYAAEGISVGAGFTFKDNADIVSLLDSKGGIFSILDEEVSMPKASDHTFLSKAVKAHEKHQRLVAPKFAGDLKFGIRHFAGEVSYSCEGFLEKNVDRPPDEAPALLETSGLSVLREVGAHLKAEVAEAAAAAAGRGKKVKTVSSSFRASLASLVGLLGRAEPHFIRCVKPNNEKVPALFTSSLVMEQLMSSGVFEAVRIRQSGYASRIPCKDFLGRYRVMAPKGLQPQLAARAGAAPEQLLASAKAFLEALPSVLSAVGINDLPADSLVMGKSKIFAKAQAIAGLERCRDLALSGYAVAVQKVWRGHRTRDQMKSIKNVYNDLMAWVSQNNYYASPGSKNTAFFKLKTADRIEEEARKAGKLIETARLLSMELGLLTQVKKVHARMENEVATLRRVKAAQSSIDTIEIEKVISRAKELELQSKDVEGLVVRVQRLKLQIPLVKAMKNAMELDDLEMLVEVMGKVRQEGLHNRPEDWVEQLRGETIAGEVYEKMERLKAEKKLEDIEKKRKEELQKQLTENVAKNEATFDVEEKEEEPPAAEAAPARRTRRVTITGLTEDGLEKVKIALLAACHELDAPQLEEGLAEATAQGVEGDPVVAEAQDLFEKMQTEAYLIAAMQEQQAAVCDKEKTLHALKCLANLGAQAKRLGVAAEAAAEAKEAMQRGVRQRARSTIRGSIFFKVDMEELDLAMSTFDNLASFPGLKPAERWKGHKAGGWFQFGDRGPESMLKHSRNGIKEALTKVPVNLETKAVASFHNILGWMSDRPMPECQRLGYAQDVVEAAKAERNLGDEVYVQVMKQLTENPSQHSALLGWKLMLLLCQQVCPSARLDDFVHAFLLKAVHDQSEEAAAMARQCVSDLNAITQPDKVSDEEDSTPVQVLLIDQSTRKVRVPPSSTLEQLGERLSAQLRITNARDFSFFQLTDGLEMHRLLPSVTVLSSLFQKWQKLKDVTGRASRLLYKRRFLRVDEGLCPGDLTHATLSYRQAIWDYIHYPISEDVNFVCAVAASVLSIESDHFRESIQKGRLDEEGVLEQLIPEISMREQKPYKWSMKIMARYHELSCSVSWGETRLAKMSRCFSLLQRMKLFGAYYWLGRQTTSAVPAELVAIQEAPPQVVKINPKEPEAEYWICVDLFGVRFVSVDSTPGRGFQRGFLFNEEAVERVLLWGARQNYVQFVVSTVNPALPAAGRVPMTITMISPAAVDIAYAVHTIQRGSV